MVDSSAIITKNSDCIEIIVDNDSISSMVLLKADDNELVEYQSVEVSNFGNLPYPNQLWKSASISVVLVSPISKGPRKSPPKGYPSSRSDYAVPETYELPVDRSHIRGALSYFSHKKHWSSSEQKRSAAKKILRRASKYNIKVSPDSAVSQAAKGGFPLIAVSKAALVDFDPYPVISILNNKLAVTTDLALRSKQAHWNVKGPNFIGLHQLFDEIYLSVTKYADTIAERIVQLGGQAYGTLQSAYAVTTLPNYPSAITNEMDHLIFLSISLKMYGADVRQAITQSQDLKDWDTADIFTDISRGADKYLWMIEAHLQR